MRSHWKRPAVLLFGALALAAAGCTELSVVDRALLNEIKTIAEAAALDAAAAKRALDWRPKLAIGEALAWTVEWYRGLAEGGDAAAKSLKCPTLSIMGEKDMMTPLKAARRIFTRSAGTPGVVKNGRPAAIGAPIRATSWRPFFDRPVRTWGTSSPRVGCLAP